MNHSPLHKPHFIELAGPSASNVSYEDPMRTYLKLISALFVALLATGCIGSTTYHTATPIPQGEVEIGVLPGVYGISTDAGTIALPQVGFGVRAGVSENMDFGARINGPLLTADLNIAVVNNPDFAFSIDPSVSAFYFSVGDGSVFWMFADVGLLADLVKTESTIFTMGLKPGYIYASTSAGSDDEEISASGDGFTVGLTAGVKIKLGESLSLMPSVDVLTPVENFGDGVIFNAGVGILF